MDLIIINLMSDELIETNIRSVLLEGKIKTHNPTSRNHMIVLYIIYV